MPSNVGVYLDANGVVAKIVVTADDNFAPHADAALLFVPFSRKEYDALPKTLNVDGLAVPHDLLMALQPAVASLDKAMGAKLQAKIASVDASLAATAVAADEVQALASQNKLFPPSPVPPLDDERHRSLAQALKDAPALDDILP